MTRLCSYYEHLVLPDKSILGKKVALDSSSLCLTDSSLCDSDHFIGRNTNPMCAPNTQSLHLSVSVLTVDVLFGLRDVDR